MGCSLREWEEGGGAGRGGNGEEEGGNDEGGSLVLLLGWVSWLADDVDDDCSETGTSTLDTVLDTEGEVVTNVSDDKVIEADRFILDPFLAEEVVEAFKEHWDWACFWQWVGWDREWCWDVLTVDDDSNGDDDDDEEEDDNKVFDDNDNDDDDDDDDDWGTEYLGFNLLLSV